MAVTSTLKKQADLPVWEWMRFSPVTTSSLTCLTTARDGSERYLYYFGSNVLYRYDTWGDSWQQLSTGITPVTTLSARYVKTKGFRGNVLASTTTSLRIPSTGGKNIDGLKIRIISGTGAGQERTIVSTSDETIHEQGLVTTATANILTDSTKKWRFNQWEGYTVRLIYNTGFSQFREIIYNDTTSITVFDANYDARNFLMSPFSANAPYGTPVATAGSQANFIISSQLITVDSPWDVTPSTDSKFMILSGGIWWLSSNASTPFFNFYYYDILSDRWVQKLTPTGIFSAAIGTDFAIAPLSETFGIVFSSTATTATTMTLTDTGQTMTNGQYINNYIQITGGTGIGQIRRIISNTSNRFVLNKKWDVIPDNTSTYTITQDDSVYLVGNARSQMLKYSPESSVWSTGNIVDDNTTLNLALLRTNGQHHGVTTATRATNGITGVNATPTAAGSGYVVGDLLTISTGGSLGRVIVESVNSAGAVLSVSLYTAGSGYSVGTGRATTGGAGTSCTIEITSVGTIGVVTTSINHDFDIGDSVTFAGATEAAWNTSYSILGIQSATVVEMPITATANAVATFTLATNLLVDVSKNWSPNEHAGKIIGVQSNGLTGTITWRRIMGNSTNTISFLAGTAPTNGNSRYFIQDLDAIGSDVAYMADAELPYGYATSGTTGVLIDSGKTWTNAIYTNVKVNLIDTSGNTSEDIITSNTNNTLNIGRTVAGGSGTNTLAYSDDNGLTWVGLGTSVFSSACNAIAWSGTRFVAVGSGTNTIAWSNDGITWIGLGTTIFPGSGTAVAWNGSRFVAVGSGANTLAWSNDGITWTGLGVSIFGNTNLVGGVAWTGTRFVAVCEGLNSIAWSNDGITWTGLGTSVFTSARAIAWNGSRLVAVGSGTNSIAYSDDNGLTWTGLGTIMFTRGNGISWNGSRFVALGFTAGPINTIAHSTDGITWTGLGTSTFSSSGNGVGWNGQRFIAGGSGTNTLAQSTDGITWAGLGSGIFTTSGLGVASTTPFASLTPNIGLRPTQDTRYKIHDAYGSASAGSTTTLTDNNKRWKTNQWAGKRLLITSSTGIQQELTVTQNTATQLTFGTATAPDATSTYSILGRAPVGLGVSVDWNWGMTGNTSDKGRFLISPRGGGSHTFDLYDLKSNRWMYGDFIFGQGETLTTGSMYVYDGQNRVYFTKDTTGRVFYYDINKKSIEPFATIPYGMSTAILGNRMEIITTEDGLQYLYIMRHTGTEMWRCLIQN